MRTKWKIEWHYYLAQDIPSSQINHILKYDSQKSLSKSDLNYFLKLVLSCFYFIRLNMSPILYKFSLPYCLFNKEIISLNNQFKRR
jgi:hypothetical protein